MTGSRRTRLALVVAACGTCVLAAGVLAAQQQIVDPDFVATVTHPAYRRGGPTVAIDEAHSNFHTASGQYAPFADLLRSDGYTVVASTKPFEPADLASVRVLVIANARNLAAILAGDISKPAFTDHEGDVVATWVRGGGSLLLIADHAPFGTAADTLARRFGVVMGTGWAFDRAGQGITTQLEFSRANGLLGRGPIVRGRNEAETVSTVRAFTGQSLGVPAGATVLMALSPTAREAKTPDDLDAEDAAARAAGGSRDSAYGQHSHSVAGAAQGLALRFGKGRVVVIGEAALFSAQILRFRNGDQVRDTKIGMNVPGTDDRQFALNVVHWLSGVLN